MHSTHLIYVHHLPHLMPFARLLVMALIMGMAVACGQRPASPISPASPVASNDPDAAPDGSTLKATIPATIAPIGGAQADDPFVLVASKASAKYADVPLSYQFQVRSGSTIVYDSGATGGVGSGANVTHAPTSQLEPDTTFTWRVRAVYQGAVGSWSGDASFKSPIGAYIRGGEIRDPLTIGRTVGTTVGPVQFVKDGLELMSHASHVTYQLPDTLTAGEFSLMVTGIDEGSPGDKTKIMSMQEGHGDITTNDYRFTVEKRGRSYVTPGAVTFRIINGEGGDEDFINDGVRIAVPFSDERWYFWKATWSDTTAALEVREDGPTGRLIYNSVETTNGHPYRPSPHVIHLGSPLGRAGEIDASIPGAFYKDVWVSARPRPAFPATLVGRPQ
jgi:hypothetical protein